MNVSFRFEKRHTEILCDEYRNALMTGLVGTCSARLSLWAMSALQPWFGPPATCFAWRTRTTAVFFFDSLYPGGVCVCVCVCGGGGGEGGTWCSKRFKLRL